MATASEPNLLKIVQKRLPNIETLQTRNRDELDFHDISVWCLKKMLEDAYLLGRADQAEIDASNEDASY